MKFKKASSRANISVVLALSIVAVFSLGSFAAASRVGDDPVATKGLPPQAPTGVLNSRGGVTINGNAAASGATIVSGNSIATGPDGSASIEFGPLGRIELQANTAVTVVVTPTSIQLTLDQFGPVSQTLGPGVSAVVADPHHDRVQINVSSGQVHIKWDNGQEQDITAGQSKVIENFIELSAAGGTTYQLGSGETPNAAAPTPKGGRRKAVFLIPLGAAALAGLGYGIAQSVGGGQAAVSPSAP